MPNNWKRTANPLLTLCIDCVKQHLCHFSTKQLECLPGNIKNRLLRKFTTNITLWQSVNHLKVLGALLHAHTKILDLTGIQLDDDILGTVECCTNLRELYLTRRIKGNITSDGLQELFRRTPNLFVIELTNCDAVNDDTIHCLSAYCPKLTGLSASYCKNITNKACQSMADMSNLLWLRLSHTNISDNGIEYLMKGENIDKIKELMIDQCPVSGCGLQMIAKICKDIEILTFFNCPTNEGLYGQPFHHFYKIELQKA